MKKYTTALTKALKKWSQETSDPSNQNRYYNFLNSKEVKTYIKQCIDEDRPIYCFAKTQSGKTQFKQELAKLVIKEKWKDVVIISTTNMIDAMEQLNDRISKNLAVSRIQSYTTNELPTRVMDRTVIITMTSGSRTEKLNNFINETIELDNENNNEHLKYMVIFDEGEEFEPAAGSNDIDGKKTFAETELWDLFFGLREQGIDIDMVKVSATLSSALLSSGTWAGSYGDLASYQLLELPLSSDYIGINHGLTFVSNLRDEDPEIFKSNTFTDQCQSPYDSKNIPRIVESIETLIARDGNKIIQVGNVVYGVAVDSHKKMASWMSDVFEEYGRKTAIWQDKIQDVTEFSKKTDILFIVQNGQSEKVSISNKLCRAADHFTNLKAVIICADKMANKSITLDTGFNSGWEDPLSNRFGFYCNFTVLYGPKNRNVEADIQYLRCTGNRPPIKEHVVFTTPDIEESILNYYQDQENNINDIKNKGKWSGIEVCEYNIRTAKKFGKGSVDKRITRTTNYGRRKKIDITLTHRTTLINQGFRAKDRLFTLNRNQFKSADNKAKVIELAKKLGFTPTVSSFSRLFEINEEPRIQVNLPHQIANLKSESGIRVKFKVGDTGDKQPDSVISMLQSGKNYFLYCIDNALTPEFTDEVEYKIRLVDGEIQFPQAQMCRYTKGGAVVWQEQ